MSSTGGFGRAFCHKHGRCKYLGSQLWVPRGMSISAAVETSF
ncbi:hypothetical protein SLEP1_g36875 [Rubroshorea leprosula]|uniref:Uncharacterized protein n=1 Tax=Rubroshorea leprosula TaxID=152421 RepID=A0AAV5KTB8_9ROSI|nr:hypothetical protein SLEP1_g36875 [Rubroshorea leprosula]